MKGIELARRFYEECAYPVLSEKFGEVMPLMAAGIFGSGSECFGYDDEISEDHDFEPGFCLMLPSEEIVDRKTAFALERAYAALPKEFMGYKRNSLAPVGGARHGVMRISDFFMEKTGTADGLLTTRQWLSLPEYSLAEAVNGEVFFDGSGELVSIRERLAYFPEDIRIKKLAGNLLLMAQSGQYNYMRCISHGELAAAQLAVFEFTKSAMGVIFLINKRYQPFYKWSFRALRQLPELALEAELLEYLITTGNEDDIAKEKYDVMEGICADIIDVLMDEGLTKAICGDLEKHAYSVNDAVADSQIRNMHILAGI